MDMKIGYLFRLDDGSQIAGNDKGEIVYISRELSDHLEGELTVIRAREGTHQFLLPRGGYPSSDVETIELNKCLVPTYDGFYVVRCGYGKISKTWIVKGDAKKLQATKAPPT